MSGRHAAQPASNGPLTAFILTTVLLLLGAWVAVYLPARPRPADDTTRAAASSSPSGSSQLTVTSPPSADQLRTVGVADALSQPNGAIKGHLPDVFLADERTPMYIELSGNADGSNQRYLVQSAAAGTVEMVFVDGTAYLRGDEAFWTWRGVPGYGTEYRNVWVRMAPAEAREVCWLYLRRTVQRALDQAQPLTDADPADLVTVASDDGYRVSRHAADSSHLEFSSDAPHRLTRVKGPATDLTFSDWGAVAPVQAPASFVVGEPYGPVEIPW